MKRTQGVTVVLTVLGLLWLSGGEATAQTEQLTTLLPTKTECTPSQSQGGMLTISADNKNQPLSRACLSFDLSVIPAESVISKATLRLVANPGNGRAEQLVRILPDGQSESVASWSSTGDSSGAFSASTSNLSMKVAEAFIAKKELSFTLSSSSRLSHWEYYSTAEYGGTSSNKPRLIIEYKPPQVLLDREQERDTTKTRWTFFPRPNNVMVKPFFDGVKTIISNPIFYEDGIYLFAQPTAEKTMLYSLNPGGGNRWGPKEIQIRPGSHALVTNAGRLYSVGENRLVIYNLGDLEKGGTPIKTVDIKDFKPALRPTLGTDGSIYAMPSGSGFLYGFNSAPLELWRYPSVDSKLSEASRITLSPDAGRYAYVLTKVGTQTHPARIDTATGSAEVYNLNVKIKSDGKETDKSLDLGFKGFHRPVAIKGPQQDYIFLSAYTEQNGMLLAHSGGEVIWWKEGPVSQPIVNRDQNVIAVQTGKVHVYSKFNGADDGTDKSCSSKESQLDKELKPAPVIAATSNLVLDGEDNLYFWNNGTLFGYTKACENFLSQRLAGLPENLELMFAPDGTLYARTDANNLYTITPNQKELTLAQANLQTDTIYSAETIKVAANLQVKSATKVSLKAQKSISIGPGFKVEKGATITARTGF